MRPHRVLVLYGTNYGQTLEIATRVANLLEESGALVSCHDVRGRAEARRCAEEFLRATHWRPAMTELIGGALAYTKYGLLLRWIMRRIAKQNGESTDTSCDHEMTDWAQVTSFAERFAALLNHTQTSDAAVSVR